GLSPQSATLSPVWTSHALPLSSLTLADRPRMDHALASSTWMGDMPLAAYAFVYHYIWRSMLTYSWTEIDEHLCLFAESPDGLFMPLLPLGPEPLGPSLAGAMELMRRRNGGSSISRVENVPEEQKTVLEALDYRLSRKDSDYLYRASDLCEVAGDRYKSQRAACNRFEREHRAGLTSYRTDEQEECLSLFRIWSSQKVAQGLDEMARYLLADTESAHHEALANHEALGLTGAVLRVEGAIRAYTLGYRLSPTIFCVLLEVADRTIPGLAPFLFRETCRTARSQGASFINTMDDSGLSRLAASKQAYRPIRLLSNWIVTPA
ncbi:MAG: DUF2156 domain-containing protein, partial [Nitrospiraceae bacterium]